MASSSNVHYTRLQSEESISFLGDDPDYPDPTTSTIMSSKLADNNSVKANTEVREDIEASRTSKDGDQGMERVELTEEDVRIINPILRRWRRANIPSGRIRTFDARQIK